ncbi:REX4 RNA exonuclease 4 [Candida maltosa Xu316]
MAFPLDQSELISHLRTTYIILNEDSNYSRNIIKPFQSDENVPKFQSLSDSPPITFEIARHLKKTINNNNNNNKLNDSFNSLPYVKKPKKSIKKKSRKKKLKKLKSTEKNDPITPTQTDVTDILSKPDEPRSRKDSLGYSTSDSNANYTTDSIMDKELTPIAEPNGDEVSKPDDSTSDTTPSSNGGNFGLRYTKTIRGTSGVSKKSRPKSRSKIPIVKFFQSGKEEDKVSNSDSDSDSDSDVDERKMKLYAGNSIDSTLNTIEDVTTEDGDITEKEKDQDIRNKTRKTSRAREDHSDAVTIDSDFGVPVNSKGHVVHNYQPGEDISDDDDDDEDEDEDEEDGEYDEYDTEEGSADFESVIRSGSNDSEFTDLDNDSMVDSSLILDSTYNDNGGDSFSFVRTSNVSEFDSRKNRKKKKNDSFDQHTVPKTTSSIRLRSSSVSHNKSMLGISALAKKPTLQFEKIVPSKIERPKDSNLSTLIHSKYKSTNTNPLNYYSFVEPSTSSMSHKASIDIFVPPNRKAVITNLSMVDNVAISDCIGYVLLHLCKLPQFNNINDFTYLNPNHWRLELVDEDGENYGSFGILDRTRLLSSYNNPKELAICKVTEPNEMKRNDTQSPLPVEFKKSLDSFQRKRHSINQIVETEFGDSLAEKIELQIGVYEYDGDGMPRKQSIKVPSDYSMGQVLKEFCGQHGLIPTKYRFKLVDESTGQSRFVRDVERCGDLTSLVLELIPSETKYNSIIEASYDNGMMLTSSKITPSDYTLPNITPNADQLEERVKELSIQDLRKQPSIAMPNAEPDQKVSINSANSIKQAISSNKYLDDILKGNNPELPINLNTIYFKWKVLKNNSKMKIKNFSEKNFIIDGDYIHLTPPDELTLRAPGESSVTNVNGHHNHHHNYLNHQFNKNHNKQSSKTYSFHITQIFKLKQYVKNPNYFRIIIQSQQVIGDDDNANNNNNTNGKEIPMKKFYLIAANESECSEIINKLKWVLQIDNDQLPTTKPATPLEYTLWTNTKITPTSVPKVTTTTPPHLTISTINDSRKLDPGKYVSLDCEFVGIGPEGLESALARVSIVNYYGVILYDAYVRPNEKVTDFRTWVSGIRSFNLRDADDLKTAQKKTADIIEGKILVGHAVSNDLEMLFLSHPKSMIRDTSRFKKFRETAGGKAPSLKKLMKEFMDFEIQVGEHSSVEDARATMLLFRLFRREIEGPNKR